MSDRHRHALATLLLLGLMLIASMPDGATGASSSVVVTLDIPSAISLTNNCQDPRGYQLGIVQPGTPATTTTNTGICSLAWDSSNDTAMLRIAQRDNTGTAMARSGVGTPSSFDNSTLHAVDVYDGTRVVAVGRSRIRWSTDGGTTWSQQVSPGGAGCWCRDVQYVPGDPTKVFFVGDSAMVRATGLPAAPTFTNLFTTMTSGNPTDWPAAIQITGVAVLSASTIIVSGEDGWTATSTNADQATPSWTVFQVGAGTLNWVDIDALDANTMYMVGEDGRTAYTTTGGGAPGAWTIGVIAGGYTLRDLSIADATHLYTVGDEGRVYTCTANPCTPGSWVDRTSTARTTDSFLGVSASAATPNTAFAVSSHDGAVFRSTDGGVNWTRQDGRQNVPLLGVGTSDGAHAVAVGSSRMTIRTDDGTNWTITAQAGISPLRDVDAAPVDGKLILGAGRAGLIRRSTDGGATWSTIASGTTDSLFGVSFGTDLVAWSVGANGRIIKSLDGGLTWSSQTSGTAVRLLGVQAVDAYTAWAVGDSGTVLRTTNGGVNWITVPTTTTDHLRGVSATSALNAWVVGENSTIRVTTDGGGSWLTPTTIPSAGLMLHGVSALDTQTAWIATDWLNIWRTTDGGVTWTAHNAGGETWFSVEHASATVLYAGGSNGAWSVSSDGGTTWTMTGGSNPYHYGVAAIDETRAVVGGESGSTVAIAPAVGATSQVADYGVAPSDWASSGTTSLFGVCLQDVSAATSVAAGWVKDTTGGPRCTASDTDPWRDVPPAATKIATTAAGGAGRIDVVWGLRPRTDQASGTYTATVVFEALAPAI